jgi:hypothetical protein
VDVAPKSKTTPREKIAQLVRVFGTTERGERANAWRALERMMDGAGITWTDVGNWIEHGGEPADGAYTEDDLQQFGQARHAEGLEAGIKIGEARGQTRHSNGHFVLPEAVQMAEYCRQRPNQLKDDKQREFVDEVYGKTLRGMNLKPGPLGYLASLYIKLGGRIK